MADVVLINMCYTDLGRSDASNYGIFKVIFDANLKLFGQKAKKKLVFVIRDFDPRSEINTVRQQISTDLDKIWRDIVKEGPFENSQFSQFFSVDYVAMPNKIYEP